MKQPVTNAATCVVCALSVLLEQLLGTPKSGKVRETYSLPGHPDKLLVVASDRVSIFDFVLGVTIPHKGEVLTAITIFWLTEVFAKDSHHLLAYGSGIDEFLPDELKGNDELRRRGLIVRKLDIVPVECIARAYLLGSAYDSYMQTGEVCGNKIRDGLKKGDLLDKAIFTPTTKAETGHDLPLTVEYVNNNYGTLIGDGTLDIFRRARQFALQQGIILADTKFEFGIIGTPNGIDRVLADEVLTPDSSRFCDQRQYEQGRRSGALPQGMDKQFLREAGKHALINDETIDISTRDPANSNDVALVKSWVVPSDIIDGTCAVYQVLFAQLTGRNLQQFQAETMGI